MRRVPAWEGESCLSLSEQVGQVVFRKSLPTRANFLWVMLLEPIWRSRFSKTDPAHASSGQRHIDDVIAYIRSLQAM